MNELKRVVIYKYKQELNRPNDRRIPHHRYNLFFENGELSILPYDGTLRIKHIIIEIQIIEEYLNRKLSIEIIDDNTVATQVLDNAINDIISKLTTDNLIGVVVGSISNINFFVNYKIRRHIYQDLIKKNGGDSIEKYVSHRLRVSEIENALLHGLIENVDSCIFQEGALPTQHVYDYVECIYENLRIPRTYHTENKLLYNYLALDYIFFNDLKHGTKIFDESTQYPETQIFSNNLLTYQILNIPNKKGKYLNISWIEPTILGHILKEIQKEYSYKEFLMYGKCGALENSIKVGSIVAPKSVFGKDQIPIANNFQGCPTYDFISVDSPLVETKSWLKNALSSGISCVEMELYDIFERIKLPERIEISYYISDNLSSDFKLSNRFDFLHQRLFLSERIVNLLF